MWPQLRSSVLLSESRHLGMPGGEASSKLLLAKHRSSSSMQSIINVNDEYRKALRTKSYVDVWTRIHRHLPRRSDTTTPPWRPLPRTPSSTRDQQDGSTGTCTTPLSLTPTSSSPSASSSSSPFSSYSHLPEYLLETQNEVEELLVPVRDPKLHALFLDYFEATLQACYLCGSLLGSVDQLRREHRTIRMLLGPAAATDYEGLAYYVELENPLSSLATTQFHRVHDVYESLIRRLVLARDGIIRRTRLARLVRRAWCATLVAACGVLATAVAHAGGRGAGGGCPGGGRGPALGGPFSAWLRKRRRAGAGRLVSLGAQLDAAARGAYIMSRDMETMSRMVVRLYDEVEHGKEVVRLFLRSGEVWLLRELDEWGDHHGCGFAEQLDELEEHVYWCLLTINRIRGLVSQEIASDASSPSAQLATTSSSPLRAMHA